MRTIRQRLEALEANSHVPVDFTPLLERVAALEKALVSRAEGRYTVNGQPVIVRRVYEVCEASDPSSGEIWTEEQMTRRLESGLIKVAL